MSRKRCKRRVLPKLPPRGLRPKLDRGQIRDLGLVHNTNLDLISKGLATERELWDMVGGVFTWSRAADLLPPTTEVWLLEPDGETVSPVSAVEAMRAQLAMCTQLVERFGRTGRVGFSGVEYQLAKRGVDAMDQLAELVDAATASAASEWGEDMVNKLAASCEVRAAA
jgi:hypothetical protein